MSIYGKGDARKLRREKLKTSRKDLMIENVEKNHFQLKELSKTRDFLKDIKKKKKKKEQRKILRLMKSEKKKKGYKLYEPNLSPFPLPSGRDTNLSRVHFT